MILCRHNYLDNAILISHETRRVRNGNSSAADIMEIEGGIKRTTDSDTWEMSNTRDMGREVTCSASITSSTKR